MTIKNRLFISNILMIVIPLALSIGVTGLVSVAIRNSFHVDNRRIYSDGDNLHLAIEQTRIMTSTWTEERKDFEYMQSDMDRFGAAHGQRLSLALFSGGEPVYSVGREYDTVLLKEALNQKGRHSLALDDIYVYTDDVNGYKIVLTDAKYKPENPPNFEGIRNELSKTITLGSVFVVVIILGTNIVLTYTVYRSIMLPLGTLASGVQQIRDGDLSCKISYLARDEFAPVCENFNDMAGRLKSMVNAVQQDDENRKLLIAGMSHDIRTPLTSIKGYAIGLEQGIDLTPETRMRYISTIRRKTDEIERMINQLFTISKLDIGEFPIHLRRLDVGRALEEFIAERADEYRQQGLEISLIENVRGAEADIDMERLRDVLVNVLENAVRYGGTGPRHMEIASRAGHGVVEICLTDDGPGAPPEDLDKLFKLFYRGDKSRNNPSQGSGLGLPISAMIMERMSGTVAASNVISGGTVCGFSVTLRLPLAGNMEMI